MNQEKLAIEDMTQYTAELGELEQIASPSHRYEEVSGDSGKSLLEAGAWTKERCLAFVDLARRRVLHSVHVSNETVKKSCDEQRDDLQQEFETSYSAVADLRDSASKRAEDTSCVEDAAAKQ